MNTFGDELQQHGPDPLGVVGWVIGGKYKVRSYIGGGGFGEVYEGFNTNLPQQRLVLKFFKEVAFRERFDREAQILCRLDHPNISRVMDYYPDENALVMQYIDGHNTDQLLQEKGPLETELFLKVARNVSAAVAFAHKQGIAHRDLKPGNILVDKNGHVYLIDFGIAKETTDISRTRTGYAALSVNFAAPERQGGRLDYNPYLSDVYELGITLFNLATKSFPYRNPAAPLLDEWKDSAGKTLAPGLRAVLKRATNPDPKKRYQSVDLMTSELNEVDSVYLSRGYSKIGVAAAGIVILAVAGYFLYPVIFQKGEQGNASQSTEQSGGQNSESHPESSIAVAPVSNPADLLPTSPVLRAPADGTKLKVGDQITLEWQGNAQSGESYTVEIADNSSFAGANKYEQIRESKFTPTGLISPGTHYWRVTAVSADGRAGEPSGSRTLQIEATRALASTSTVAVADQGILSLTVDQPSDIYVNNQLKRENSTTWQETLPVGSYDVRIQHGSDKRQWLNETLAVAKGRTTSKSFLLPAQSTGSLKILSTPPGARVQIDGANPSTGKTPFATTVSAGPVRISVSSPDDKVRRDSTIRVTADKETSVNFAFEQTAALVSSPTDKPATVESALPAVDNEKAIRQTITRFQEAMQRADIDALKAVWPTISDKDQDAYKASFASTGGMVLTGNVSNIDVSGTGATAVLAGTAKPKAKGSRSSPVKFEFTLLRDGSAWMIKRVTAIK